MVSSCPENVSLLFVVKRIQLDLRKVTDINLIELYRMF